MHIEIGKVDNFLGKTRTAALYSHSQIWPQFMPPLLQETWIFLLSKELIDFSQTTSLRCSQSLNNECKFSAAQWNIIQMSRWPPFHMLRVWCNCCPNMICSRFPIPEWQMRLCIGFLWKEFCTSVQNEACELLCNTQYKKAPNKY